MKAIKRDSEYWRKARTVWSWDVEASDPDNPWDTPTLVVAKSEHGDEERYVGPDCMHKTAALMRRTRGTWLAHYGGGYDVPLMLNVWRQRRIVLSGSRILAAEQAPDLKLRDTYPWWLASLAKVGKAVGVEKLDVDRAQLERLTLAEQADYCSQDCEVVLAGYRQARACLVDHFGAKPAWTAGQSAANIVEAVEPGTWRALTRNRVHVDDAMTCLSSGAVRGGRVECRARGIVEGVYVYDVKSSYPARYAARDVGVGLRRAEPGDRVRVDRCRWRWPWRERFAVALDQATMCGAGDSEAWLIDEEQERLERAGVRVERLEGWAPLEVMPIAQAFARLLYELKESGGPFAFFAKVWLNSWHGKASMRPLQEQYTDWLPEKYYEPAGAPERVPEGLGWWHRYYTLEADDAGLLKPFQQPMIASLVLGRARVALYDGAAAVEAAGFPVLYCDTDSIMTTCPPDRFPLGLGQGLGQWSLEGGPFTARFLGPKAYCLTDADGIVRKCALKGVPHASYRDGVYDELAGYFREARGLERLAGKAWATRKGRGRDVRVELFDRALAGGARCLKDGVTTFLRGLRAKGDHERRWVRAPVVRTVAPSGRGRVFDAQGCRYLAAVEVVAATALERLPEHAATFAKKVPDAARAFVLERGLAEVVSDTRRLPRLPREVVQTPRGPRRRVDLVAAYRAVLEAGGVLDHDGEAADRRWLAWWRGGRVGEAPPAWRGGELDGLARELGERPSCPLEGFARLARRCTTWLDLHRSPAVRALAEVPGLERCHVPAELVVADAEVVALTERGARWLAAMGPRPLDAEDDSDDSAW